MRHVSSIQYEDDAVATVPASSRNVRLRAPVLIILEGVHDVEFLRRLTAKLHNVDQSIPDLAELERRQRVIFVPFGGGHVLPWAQRFAPLDCPEYHLYDREDEPETAVRREAAQIVNARSGCRALILTKRSLESYLHPTAIFEAGGGEFKGDRDVDVASSFAQIWYSRDPHLRDWDELSSRARRRLATQAKRWLNSAAVPYMTFDRLVEMDPTGEFIEWLRDIGTSADNG